MMMPLMFVCIMAVALVGATVVTTVDGWMNP